MNRGRLALVLALAAAAVFPAAAHAELRFTNCSGDRCATLTVPLDHSGAVPGTLRLRVARAEPIGGHARAVALVVPGGPGVRGEDSEYEWVERLPAHDIVTFDPRGSGAGGLRCRDLEAATQTDAGREAEACAALLGTRRAFFRASDTVEDMELLRAELGADRLTVVANGYGSYVAQRYALRYPERVIRLVFDGVVDAGGVDPLYLDSVAAARRVLADLCRSACRSFTRDAVGDTARLVAQLAAEPLRGPVVRPDGTRRGATLTGHDLLFTLLATDSDVFSRADYPAAVASALRGDPAPLLRLKRRAAAGLPPSVYPSAFSAATYTAASCEEIRFPWAWHSSPAERDEAAHRTESQMAPALAAPFDPASLVRSDLMRLCRRWPTASPEPPPDPGPMPDVPVLMLANRTYLGMPVETAKRAAARFPRAEVLATPAAFWDDDCAERAVRRFVRGLPVQDRCARGARVVRPGRLKPASLGALPPARGVRGARGRLVSAVGVTLGDLIDDIYARLIGTPELVADGDDFRLQAGGLRGGFVVVGEDRLLMNRYEVVPGVRLSGRWLDDDAPVRVDGPGRLDGVLRTSDLDDGLNFWVRGRIAGRRIRGRGRLPSHILELVAEEEDGRGVSGARASAARLLRRVPGGASR